MENIFNNLKNFLISNVNPILANFQDDEINLPEFKEKFIIFGTVDITKYNSPIIASILIDEQGSAEGDIRGEFYGAEVTLTLLCSGDTSNKLLRKMCRYASAVKSAIKKSHTLNRTVYDCNIESLKPYYDVGTSDRQMSAIEIVLTITTRE